MCLTPHTPHPTPPHCGIVDGLGFLAILVTARRQGRNKYPGIPSILESILRDATINFVLMFISHLLFLLFLVSAPVGDIRYAQW
jgi:hypothetical protein